MMTMVALTMHLLLSYLQPEPWDPPNSRRIAMSEASLSCESLAASGLSVSEAVACIDRLVGATDQRIAHHSLLMATQANARELESAERAIEAAPGDKAIIARRDALIQTIAEQRIALDASRRRLVALAVGDQNASQLVLVNEYLSNQTVNVPNEMRVLSWSDIEMRKLARAVIVEQRSQRSAQPLDAGDAQLLMSARSASEVISARLGLESNLQAVREAVAGQ